VRAEDPARGSLSGATELQSLLYSIQVPRKEGTMFDGLRDEYRNLVA
jgi:hypothetical protein